jgi:hypothetical protein
MVVLPGAFRVEIKGTRLEAACICSMWHGGPHEVGMSDATSLTVTAGSAESVI